MTALPDSIIQNGLFCCWKYEERNGRKTKVPYQPETGLGAKSNDPSSFVPYKTAVQASGYDGIGIGIFNGICAIDLDNCLSDSGYYTQTAAEIVALMHSYTEYSPSGNGLHILFSAKGFQYDTKRFYIMNHQAGIEVYVAGATNKYVTVTGNRCEDYEYGDRTQELQVLLDKFMRRTEVGAENAINAKNSDLSMEQLLQLAKSSKNGAAFTALWNGSLEGYSSPSEADLALCSHLAFWTGRDAAKMDTMFRQSGLMRDKWDRQQSGTTYGAITIQKAIEHCREIYTPKAEPSPVFQPIVPLTPQWSDLPAFPVDALPDVIRNYVSAVAEHSQTAPDMAAVISLGVLATCLQGKYKIEGTPGYCEPLSLYTVVIAAPGERKSSVMRDMTTFLYEYEQEYNKAHSMEIRENHLQREALERQISGLQKKLERKESREMELELRQLQEQLEETPELKPVRFFADDCSSEALTSLMAANNGVFSVLSTEGGIFDIMAGRYSNKSNIDVWLKGHCGDAIYVDRMTREAECIMHPALSAILSIQPSVLDEIMSNTTMTGRGLIARFLYEWYAKDTSNKIKSVFDARMKSGLRVSASVPYGYYRDPADKQHILIDPISAAVVQRIFQMMADGMNTGDICRTLTEEKVLTPAAYAKEYHPEQCRARVETGFCKWNRTVVLEILKRQEYLGHTILKKTVSMNFKTKERRDTTEEEQYFFPNTHEPIISEELWEKAQRNRRIVERKRLNDDIKATSVFLGLLYCSECGRKLRFGIEEKDSTGHIIMHYTCGGYRGDYDEGCSSHYINEEDLKALLTEYLRIMTKRIIQDEAAFIRELSEKWKLHQESIPVRANEDLKHTQERYAELGSRLTKLYEDFAAGLLPERQYRTLMEKYDKEQQELEKRLSLLEEEIETVEIREINPQRFVDLIKKYKDVTDLHRGMVRELIDKIVVHHATGVKPNREQKVEIRPTAAGPIWKSRSISSWLRSKDLRNWRPSLKQKR